MDNAYTKEFLEAMQAIGKGLNEIADAIRENNIAIEAVADAIGSQEKR